MFDGADTGAVEPIERIDSENRIARRSKIILISDKSNLAEFNLWAERRPLSIVRWIRTPIPATPLASECTVDPFRGLSTWVDVRNVVVYGFSQFVVGRSYATDGWTPYSGTTGVGFMDRLKTRIAAARKEADLRRDRLLRQVECLSSNSPLSRRVAMGLVRVHAWFHLVETGVMQRYDIRSGWQPVDDDDLFADSY
jgi:hypothetical protein